MAPLESFVDLNPAGYDSSTGVGIGGAQQVGYGNLPGGNSQALLWTWYAASAVDLNPAGYTSSIGTGTDGLHQVGYGVNGDNQLHALLWNGAPDSFVDLGPGQAYAVSGGKEAGE